MKQNEKRLRSDALKLGLLPAEALLPPSQDVVEAGHHAIGLYARANLYLDVESQIIVGRYVPLSDGALLNEVNGNPLEVIDQVRR
ncbi:MAG: hypothetical protein ACYCXT_11490 [Acidiferrobacteraceae bacterium]